MSNEIKTVSEEKRKIEISKMIDSCFTTRVEGSMLEPGKVKTYFSGNILKEKFYEWHRQNLLELLAHLEKEIEKKSFSDMALGKVITLDDIKELFEACRK